MNSTQENRTAVAPHSFASETHTEIHTDETTTDQTNTSFHDLELDDSILKVLDRLKFVTPTPIQERAIPIGLTGDDVIGIAQTGTGKTLAFALPILQRFVAQGKRSRGRALVILPTRELALQVEETFSKIGKPFGLKSIVLIGGAPMRPQLADLRRNPDVIIATPGRLIDHVQSRNVDLRTVDTLILDEADRMLDMGFAPQIKQILREVPEERQTLLFSATMPDDIAQIARNHMVDPQRVEVARQGTAAENVTQECVIVSQEGKNDILEDLLEKYEGTILVFARTRSRAARITRTLRRNNHNAAEIHSDRSLSQRRAALDGFKNGTYRVLVATDIAARGIDVTGIELVLNYDLPDAAEDYVHRIGRTGRAGKSGHAISFAAPDQGSDVKAIERLLRTTLDISDRSRANFDASTSKSRSRRGGGGGGQRNGGQNGGGQRSGGGGQNGYRGARSSSPNGGPQRSSGPSNGGAGSSSSRPRTFSGRNR